ncbi:hypothetical protein [Mongoliitalea lutea]|uniref:Pectate lyase superfamily protein n=1 Tax=Mongoliitalea lutea TaxID=849756 RepID=A0A8J3CXJ1_9BACT|nr:hypothetical protein [Mongoliitalea lutea]GHB38903.1 hypothetical protein GCM10008106_20140 [Mongoliitalea lutea]
MKHLLSLLAGLLLVSLLNTYDILHKDTREHLFRPESAIDYIKILEKGVVNYRDFGAVGDGKTDDLPAIVRAHTFANQEGLPVQAEDGAEYYIGGKNLTAIIQTDTDFGTAKFIIDDRNVEDHRSFIFLVKSEQKAVDIPGVSSLKRFQTQISANFSGPSIVTVTDSSVRQYIRYGGNQNNGYQKKDIFLVDKEGMLREDTPIIWDFDAISSIKAMPIDEKLLKIRGGTFTTLANNLEASHPYFNRGIAIRRSHVEIDGIRHFIEGESDQGAPYSGFVNIAEAAFVTIKNSVFTGHKVFRVMGTGGVEVGKGTYDVTINRALHVSLINCTQSNDINDRTYWGLMASNYSKNLVLDNCVFSRFDAHMGVYNATIRNSTLGHQGINAIGSGVFLLENSTVNARSLINLRQDYGSTWEGEMHIKNTVFVPDAGRPANASLFGGANSGQHDFGYTCFMPEKIIIENLHIDDRAHPAGYQGPAIFTNFNRDFTDSSFHEKYPYNLTKKVVVSGVSTTSGMPLRVSDNSFMFRNVEVIQQ